MTFKWYSVFENNKIKVDKIFLRENLYTYIYPNSINKPDLHKHLIWCSSFFIKQMQNAVHFYIEGTFIYPDGYTQLIVILF